MKLAIASDHGGFELKEIIKEYLIKDLKHEVVDFGTHSTSPVDYPDFAFLVSVAVANSEVDYGIIIDGAGIGSAIVANKVPGIRAALCNDLFSARNSREHNKANILTLGSQIVGKGLAKEIVRIWLLTEFESRHQTRIDKILNIEQRILKAVK